MVCRLDAVILQARAPNTGRQRFGHHAVFIVAIVQEMAQFVHHHAQQIDSVHFALVARRGELAVVPRRRVKEPAVAGSVGVEPHRLVGRQPK